MSAGPVNSDLTGSHDSQSVQVEGVPQYSDALKTEATTTPPSSPPIYQKSMASQSQEMPPPAAPASKTRKRSRGESADVAISVPDSSATNNNDIDLLASQEKQQDTTTDSAAVVPNAQNQRQVRSAQPAPTSAQNVAAAQKQRMAGKPEKTSKTAAPSKQVQPQIRSDESEPGSDMSSASNDPGLPEDPIEYYDWSELENRYHNSLAQMHHVEQDIFDDLGKLVSFFEVWADVGGRKETDRGFKRLKTQMSYVQNEENRLETSRLHYIKVVDAFKTVGIMLMAPNWAQSFIPDHTSLSKVRRSISRHSTPSKTGSARPEKRKRGPRITPLISTEEWAGRVVGDVDMQRFTCRDPHVARCAIL